MGMLLPTGHHHGGLQVSQRERRVDSCLREVDAETRVTRASA